MPCHATTYDKWYVFHKFCLLNMEKIRLLCVATCLVRARLSEGKIFSHDDESNSWNKQIAFLESYYSVSG